MATVVESKNEALSVLQTVIVQMNSNASSSRNRDNVWCQIGSGPNKRLNQLMQVNNYSLFVFSWAVLFSITDMTLIKKYFIYSPPNKPSAVVIHRDSDCLIFICTHLYAVLFSWTGHLLAHSLAVNLFLRIHGKSKTAALLDINMYSNLYEGELISQSMNKKKIKWRSISERWAHFSESEFWVDSPFFFILFFFYPLNSTSSRLTS